MKTTNFSSNFIKLKKSELKDHNSLIHGITNILLEVYKPKGVFSEEARYFNQGQRRED
jgi:hypothetical protein